jgi:uncharacterized protein YerC
MSWEKVSKLYGKKFRRYTGLHRHLFDEMLSCIKSYKLAHRKHATKGVSSSLSIENQLLVTVMYWREYRDQEHIATDYGVSQSTISRCIREIEDILLKSGQFSLPGRKSLHFGDGVHEIVIVDVTETPTERPKKNKNVSIVAKKSDTH